MYQTTAQAPLMLTIRQTAAAAKLPEYAVRRWVKDGTIPCIMAGSKALINYDKLVEMLNSLGVSE